MTVIRLTVHGEPAPQGSLRAFAVKGRAIVTQGGSAEGRRRLGDWRTAVATEARAWLAANGRPAPLDEPVMLAVHFWLPKPSSTPRWRWLPWKKPDLDRLVRAVGDALTGVLYVDDARIVSLVASKTFAVDRPPGVDIELVAWGAWERAEAERRGLTGKARAAS